MGTGMGTGRMLTPASWQIRKRWVLIMLVAVGQLAVVLPGSLWLGEWINDTARHIVGQRLGSTIIRHTRQLADLIGDLGPQDLADDSPDRIRLQRLIDRMGRPYGASLLVVQSDDGLVLAQPAGMGVHSLDRAALSAAGRNGAEVSAGGGGGESDGPIAVGRIEGTGLAVVALPHRGDVAILVERFGAYVRWTIISLMIVLVIISTLITAMIVHRYENRMVDINANLEKLVEQRSGELLKSRNAVIFGLAMLAESRDGETGLHLDRVRAYVRLLGDALKETIPDVDEQFVSTIEETSALHDIGKVGVPDRVLLNPERLTDEERDVMRKHPLIGFDTLLAVKRRWGDDPFLVTACEICFAHHERWDGTGYPFGLAGEDIPLSARIVALADVYDALTTKRVYKDAVPHDHAKEHIETESGKQFDPVVVEAFLRCEAKFRAVLESPARH